MSKSIISGKNNGVNAHRLFGAENMQIAEPYWCLYRNFSLLTAKKLESVWSFAAKNNYKAKVHFHTIIG